MIYEKNLMAASSKLIILAILHRGRNYGYQIIKEAEKISNGNLVWSTPMLYSLLNRMRANGLVKISQCSNYTRRKYYDVTPKGQEEYKNLRHQWFILNQIINKSTNK